MHSIPENVLTKLLEKDSKTVPDQHSLELINLKKVKGYLGYILWVVDKPRVEIELQIDGEIWREEILTLWQWGLDERIENAFYVTKYIAGPPAYYAIMYQGNGEPFNLIKCKMFNLNTGGDVVVRTAKIKWWFKPIK